MRAIDEIVSIIGTVGFPIVMCGAAVWFIKYLFDRNTTQIESITKEHRQEMSDITQALANNTLVMQKLVDVLEKEKEMGEDNIDV